MSTTVDEAAPDVSGAASERAGVQSMSRNALWLMVSSAGTAVLGLVYWAVAGSNYSVEQYGRDGAIISAMLGVSAIGQLNLPAALMRFLPAVGPRRLRLAVGGFAAVVLASALAALVALTVLRRSVEGLEAATSDRTVTLAFVAGAALWSVFVLQDAVLIAIRRTVWVPWENIGFAALKIALLYAFADSVGGFGIFFSWVVAMIVVLVPVNGLVTYLVHRSRREPVLGSAVLARLGRGGVVRMVGLDYGAAVVGQAYAQFLPVVVLGTSGVTASAAFIVPFTAATALDTLVLALLQSFTAEAASDESRTVHFARASALRAGVLVVAGTVGVLVLAPLLLAPFGLHDADLAVTLLRIVILACAGRAVLALYEALCRMQGRTGLILVLQVLVGAAALGGAAVGGVLFGATGVAWAWVVAHLVLAAAVLPWLFTELELRGPRGPVPAPAGGAGIDATHVPPAATEENPS